MKVPSAPSRAPARQDHPTGSENGEDLRVVTNEDAGWQDPASDGDQKRVKGVEPSTFTLATSLESIVNHPHHQQLMQSEEGVDSADHSADPVSGNPTNSQQAIPPQPLSRDDAELRKVMASWNALPPALRAAILAMVHAVKPSSD